MTKKWIWMLMGASSLMVLGATGPLSGGGGASSPTDLHANGLPYATRTDPTIGSIAQGSCEHLYGAGAPGTACNNPVIVDGFIAFADGPLTFSMVCHRLSVSGCQAGDVFTYRIREYDTSKTSVGILTSVATSDCTTRIWKAAATATTNAEGSLVVEIENTTDTGGAQVPTATCTVFLQ